MVSRIEQARQNLIGDRMAKKLPAHVAAIEDAFVDGIAFGCGELGVGLNVIGLHHVPFPSRAPPWRRTI
jgi:hypothetical protein